MASTTIVATVHKVNGTGFQVAERPDWINVSQYAKAEEVPMPAVGQRVEIVLDGKGYARKISPQILAASAEVGQGPEPAASTPAQAPRASRDTVITRLACMNTAVAILASGGKIAAPAAVVTLAGKLEIWALRTDDGVK